MKKGKREVLKNKIQESTERGLSSFFKKSKLDAISFKLLSWAENNRKKMFVITLIFLLIVVIISFIFRPSSNYQMNDNSSLDSISIPINNIKSKGGEIWESIFELTELQAIQNEIEVYKSKEILTREDSIRIIELIDLLNNYE